MSKPTYVYVTYIKASAERVWQALTDGEITRQYWAGQQNASEDDWADTQRPAATTKACVA